jgi:hypothetical protein
MKSIELIVWKTLGSSKALEVLRDPKQKTLSLYYLEIESLLAAMQLILA